MEKAISIINLKLEDLKQARAKIKTQNNTRSKGIINGKTRVLQEILAELLK